MGGGAAGPKELGKVWHLADIHIYLCTRQVKQVPSSPVDCSHPDAKAMPMGTLAARPSWVPDSQDFARAQGKAAVHQVCAPPKREPGAKSPSRKIHPYRRPWAQPRGLQSPGGGVCDDCNTWGGGVPRCHTWQVGSFQYRPRRRAQCPPTPHSTQALSSAGASPPRRPPLPGLQFPPALLCLVRPGCFVGQMGRGRRPLELCPLPHPHPPRCHLPHFARAVDAQAKGSCGEVGPGLGSRGLPP